jgi:diguanylate cyclase (GGDEF)-like protein
VEALDDKNFLHIGIYAGPAFMPVVSTGELAATAPVSLGYVGILVLLLMFLTIVSLQLCVGKPLARLFRACYSLLLAREAYSHVTGGGLKVPGAVTEVQLVSKGLREIRRQYDESIAAKAAKDEELKRQRSEHAEEKTFISKQYEDQLAQSEQKLTELHTKEAEEEFINSLGREIDSLKSSKQVYHRVLEKLNDKYPTSIIFGAFFKVSKTLDTTLDAYLGFDERSIQALKNIDHIAIARQIFSGGQYMQIGASNMREHGFQQLAQNNNIRNIVYLPVRFQNRNLGMLAFYFVQEGQTVQERLRVLRNVVDLTARTLYQVVLYEEETEASRTDPMTGLRNKKFFYELMPQVFDRAASKPDQNPISLIMIDGDHFKSINDTYGHQVGDLMLQELSKTIKSCVRTDDSLDRATGPGDYIIRYGGEEFLVVMEMTDKNRALSVAERIRSAVEEKHDWPGGIVKWTISLGVSTFPADGKNAEDLMGKADTALYYVKEELGRNKVCHSQAVPRTYKSKKTAAAIGGELGVFDAAGLLQSIATSQKTGVLTVQAGDGKQLWMLFEMGKPIQARMGKIQGGAAITEFLVCFEDGSFNFKELAQTGKDAKLPKLDDSYNVTRSLERSLMDGALAQDNYNAAKTIVSTSEIYIRPVPQEEFNAKWAALGQLGDDAPMPDEFNAMTEIVKKADGNTTLTKIFATLDPMPTHLRWRAAALMVQHGLVQTKPA